MVGCLFLLRGYGLRQQPLLRTRKRRAANPTNLPSFYSFFALGGGVCEWVISFHSTKQSKEAKEINSILFNYLLLFILSSSISSTKEERNGVDQWNQRNGLSSAEIGGKPITHKREEKNKQIKSNHSFTRFVIECLIDVV